MNPFAHAVLAALSAPIVLALGSWLAMGVGDGAARSLVFALVPVLMVLPFYAQFKASVIDGDIRTTVRVALLWALATSVFTIAYMWVADANAVAADALIWNARTYREDMFHWIRTGIGQEGSPAIYMPQHAAHFLAFAILCLVSRGLFGLVLGAALLNYMNAYVVALLVRAESPWLVAPFAWPAYAMVRVVGFICVATALTAIALRKRTKATVRPVRVALWLGFGLVVADLALKAVLAPLYRSLFQRFVAP